MFRWQRVRGRWSWAVVLAALAGAAFAAMQIVIDTPVGLSDGLNSDKPKIQLTGSGLLIAVYGDSPANAQDVYDVKEALERKARDIFVRTCMPDASVRCDDSAQWSPALNISNSALASSITTDWRGIYGAPGPYPGDIDKASIKVSGPVVVLSWVSKYCPDGDPAAPGVQAPVQRAIKYLERGERVIPFSCTWTAYSTNNGVRWSNPIQLSSGLRDAIQDSHTGNFDSVTKKGQVAITWQEDPQGLRLGEAEGPGEGAAGALVNGGTDIWYTSATIDLSVPNTAGDDFVLASPVRLSDNWQGQYGQGGGNDPAVVPNPVLDGSGATVGGGALETGDPGASRANVALVGSSAVVAYEETKAANLPTVLGKFIRYHAFNYNAPPQTTVAVGNDVMPAGTPGCVISDPLMNGRRVRVLTQSPDEAGAQGMQVVMFWREGSFNTGGPADIVLRRGIGGVQPVNLVPMVDAGCSTSDYATVRSLGSARGENVSSNSPAATVTNLLDSTELYPAENALAHRGVLRGSDLWIGYSYTSDMNKLWAQQDNYNFWLRKYQLGVGWSSPRNLTNVDDARVNVREPRLISTPKGSASACPTGVPSDVTTTDPALCRNTSVVYLAWGTQTNVPPGDPAGPADLGVFISYSTDGGENFASPTRYSDAMGSLFQDDDSAFEAQVVTRPDGMQFYGVFNQLNQPSGSKYAMYAGGSLVDVPPPVVEPQPAALPVASGGCTIAGGHTGFDPTLWLLLAVALGAGARRRASARD
jgi:hypothetical protein